MTPLTGPGIAILLLAVIAILTLPRRWAPLPLLLVACYMVPTQGIQLMSFNFFSIRLIILAGIVRIVLRGERIEGGLNGIDRIMLVWSAWAMACSFFHQNPEATLTFNAGLVYNTCGIYFLLRVCCRSLDDVMLVFRIAVLLLVPVSLEMVYEKVAGSNLFSLLGGVPDVPNIREGNIRAQGPFAHPILAGTVGAVCLPVCIGLFKKYPVASTAGTLACCTIVAASTSSGPLLSAIFSVIALLSWALRLHMRGVRRLIVAAYLFLACVMAAPPYYLLARIDLSGGSTGYHRARLIESSYEHLGEWWLAGTDHTRHWMATGVTWSRDHTDITNHYLAMGVLGGLPLMLLFIYILWKCFSVVGDSMRDNSAVFSERRFFLWSLGASLFAHAATCISVSYFDQSFMFLYIAIASLSNIRDQLATAPAPDTLASVSAANVRAYAFATDTGERS